LASPPVLYKPALHHHADGHYHFNRLIDDTLGPNDLKVLTVLFLPNGVTPGADASSRAITLAEEVQFFFETEMTVKGYGAKTFNLVKDSGGNVVVVTINGADSLAGYQSSSDQAFDKVKQELSGHINLTNYPHQKFIYFVVFEGLDAFGQAGGVGGQFGPSGGMALIPRGVGATDAPNFNMATIAHELGHAFGLDHDFRSTGNFAPPTGKHYVMSYDSADAADYVLSGCNADYLAVDRYFNRQIVNGQPVEGTSPEIKVNTPLAYASGATSHQVEFELSDPDGLHQVQFSVITDVPVGDPHEVANDSPQIEICQLLSSVSTVTKSYNYDTHLLAVSGSKSSTGFARRLHIKVVDVTGQESYKNFTIYDQGRSPETHTFTSGSLSELLKGAWPKDIISISGTPADTGDLFIENGLLTLTSTNTNPASLQTISARLIIDGAEGIQLRSLNLTTGVSLQAFAANVVIDSCVIQSTDIAGVYIDGKSSATLTGNTIQNCSQWGVYAKTGSMVTVGGSTVQESNTVQNNNIGIQLEGVGTVNQPVLVTGNTIHNNDQDGIVARVGAVVTIGGAASGQANSILGNSTGISLFDTNTYADIVNNTIQGNQGTAGIYINDGQANITGNMVQSNLNWGIYGKPGTQLTIGGATQAEKNTVQSNRIGIQLEGVGTVQQPASIVGNTINQNTDDGIALAAGSVVIVGGQSTSRGNTISDNAQVGLSIYGNNTNVTVQNNTIQKSGSSGVFIQGGVSAVSLDANLITSNNSQGVYIQNNTTLAQITIQNNRISDNQGAVYSTSPTTEIVFLNDLIYRNNKGDRGLQLSGDATFINNTITGHSGYALVSFGADKTIKVYNTIFANNTNDWYVEGSHIVTHSLFDGSLPFGVTGNNNITGDPQFVDTANDDYHLQSTSPAINAGDNTVSGLLSEDLDGNPRISNSTVDLGVYEYGSTALIRQLAFSSPVQSIDINQDSGKITVQLQDQTGSPVASVGDLTVALSSSSATGTISASVAGAAITSITIAAGENQADFYYMDTVAGDVTLTATATIGSPAVEKSNTQTLTINDVDLIAPSISSALAATLSPSAVKAHGIIIQFSETMNPTSGNIKLVRSGETTR